MPEQLPAVAEVRNRIENASPNEVRMAFKTIHLLAARVSEVVGKASPGDTTVARGPIGGDVNIQRYEAGEVSEDVAVFNMRIAKRGGRPRSVALPLDSRFEPWTKEVVDYFDKFPNEPVFPFTRQMLWEAAAGPFVSLSYRIDEYKILEEEGELKVAKKVLPHDRNFRLHALRHLRIHELFTYYGLDPLQATTFVGWSFGGMFGGGGMMERYGHLSWSSYYPKLRRVRR